MIDYVTQLKALLHATILGDWPTLQRALFALIDLFTGPITGVDTRLPWFQLLEAVGLTAIVYYGGRQVRPSGGWRGFVRYMLPKELYTHPSAIVDYQLAILNACFGFVFNFMWRLSAVAITAVFVSWLTLIFGPAPHATAWTTPTLILVTVLIILSEDFGNYSFHYLTHKIPPLWALHRVHHSAEVLTPITAFRTHPLEYRLAAVWRGTFTSIVLAPVIYWFTGPPSSLEIFGMGATMIFAGVLGTTIQHSHIWLSFGRVMDHIICGPALHQVHHSQAPHHWDRNFGVIFSFWDWMFGTLIIPPGPEKLVLGLAGERRQPHRNALEAWFVPFWEMIPFRQKIIDAMVRWFGTPAFRLADRLNLIQPSPDVPNQSIRQREY